MDPVILGILTATVGALATYLIRRTETFFTNRKRKGLEGLWLSVSGSRLHGIVEDEIEVKITFWGIELRNKNRPHGYEYRAVGKLVENRFIYGTWESTRPGANAGGTFQFLILEQGSAMVGTFTGNASHGSFVNAWILGRQPQDLERAKTMLNNQKLDVGGPPSH